MQPVPKRSVLAVSIAAVFGLSACGWLGSDPAATPAPTTTESATGDTQDDAVNAYSARSRSSKGKPDAKNEKVLDKLAKAVKDSDDKAANKVLCPSLRQRLDGFAGDAKISDEGKPVKLSDRGVAAVWKVRVGSESMPVYVEANKSGDSRCVTRFVPRMKLSDFDSSEKRMATASKPFVSYLNAAATDREVTAEKQVCARESGDPAAVEQAKVFTAEFAKGTHQPDYTLTSPGKDFATFLVTNADGELPLAVTVSKKDDGWCVSGVEFRADA